MGTSRFDLPKLLDDPDHIADNLRADLVGFSPEAKEILDRFEFATHIARLQEVGLPYLVLGKFAGIDLHPDRFSNREMGYLHASEQQPGGGEGDCGRRPMDPDARRARTAQRDHRLGARPRLPGR